jgi:hypothetical protein
MLVHRQHDSRRQRPHVRAALERPLPSQRGGRRRGWRARRGGAVGSAGVEQGVVGAGAGGAVLGGAGGGAVAQRELLRRRRAARRGLVVSGGAPDKALHAYKPQA